MEVSSITDTGDMEGVEAIEDAEEEKSVPPDLMQNTSHGEDGSGGKANDPPKKKKMKNVHFGNEVNDTGNNDAHQRKKSDDGGKSKNLPPEKT